MAEVDITQAEADGLLALEKRKVDDLTWDFPGVGAAIRVPLLSTDRREEFYLDVRRGRIDLAKATFQNRARQVVILARLDLAGPPHRNPDGEEVPSPHLHVYREGFGDKWAFVPPSTDFQNLSDLWRTLNDFMRYCRITEPPNFRRDLFT